MNTKIDTPDNIPRDVSPERIARLLTHAAQQIDGNTATALKSARDAALERQLQEKPVLALNTGHGMHWGMPYSVQHWVTMAVILAIVIFGGLNYWQHMHESEQTHLDIAILTDDLPLEVFVD